MAQKIHVDDDENILPSSSSSDSLNKKNLIFQPRNEMHHPLDDCKSFFLLLLWRAEKKFHSTMNLICGFHFRCCCCWPVSWPDHHSINVIIHHTQKFYVLLLIGFFFFEEFQIHHWEIKEKNFFEFFFHPKFSMIPFSVIGHYSHYHLHLNQNYYSAEHEKNHFWPCFDKNDHLNLFECFRHYFFSYYDHDDDIFCDSVIIIIIIMIMIYTSPLNDLIWFFFFFFFFLYTFSPLSSAINLLH